MAKDDAEISGMGLGAPLVIPGETAESWDLAIEHCRKMAMKLDAVGDGRAKWWETQARVFQRQRPDFEKPRPGYLGLVITGNIVTREGYHGQEVNLARYTTGGPLLRLLLAAGEAGVTRKELREKLGKTDKGIDRGKSSLNKKIQSRLRVTIDNKDGNWRLTTWGRQAAKNPATEDKNPRHGA